MTLQYLKVFIFRNRCKNSDFFEKSISIKPNFHSSKILSIINEKLIYFILIKEILLIFISYKRDIIN